MESTQLIQELLDTAKEIERLVCERDSLRFELGQVREQLADCDSALDAVKAPKTSGGGVRLSTSGRIRHLTTPSYIIEREAYFANQKAEKLLQDNECLASLNRELIEKIEWLNKRINRAEHTGEAQPRLGLAGS